MRRAGAASTRGATLHLAVQLLGPTPAHLHALRRAAATAGCLLHSGTAAGIKNAMPCSPGAQVRVIYLRDARALSAVRLKCP